MSLLTLGITGNNDRAAGAPTYNYPTTNAVGAFGFRELPGFSYTGALVRVRRASDNVESDFYQGATPQTTLNTTRGGGGTSIESWLGASNGHLMTIYSQCSGNTPTMAILTAQPLIATAGVLELQDSEICISFDGSNDSLTCSILTTSKTYSAIVSYKLSNDYNNIYLNGDASGWGLIADNGGARFSAYERGVADHTYGTPQYTTTEIHEVYRTEGSTLKAYIDNSLALNTSPSAATTPSGTFYLGAADFGGLATMRFKEAVFYSDDKIASRTDLYNAITN